MALPFYLVDAFTDAPFAGNPAGVVLLDRPREEAWMGQVAMEMNQSETAFVELTPSGPCRLRWFTPARAEVALCGHATLATAHVLIETGRRPADQPIQFDTLSGTLTARRTPEGLITLDFPSDVPKPVEGVPLIGEALGVWPRATSRTRFDYLVELADEEAVRSVEPDLAMVRRLETRGLMVTAASDHDDYDFVSRFFAPALGIDEDPVTGSAHCALGPYWAKRLKRDNLVGYQASPRGGRVSVTVNADRVELGGRAVTIVVGQLHS